MREKLPTRFPFLMAGSSRDSLDGPCRPFCTISIELPHPEQRSCFPRYSSPANCFLPHLANEISSFLFGARNGPLYSLCYRTAEPVTRVISPRNTHVRANKSCRTWSLLSHPPVLSISASFFNWVRTMSRPNSAPAGIGQPWVSRHFNETLCGLKS